MNLKKTNFVPMLKMFLSNRAIVVLLLPLLIGTYLGLSLFTHQFETNSIINLGFIGLIPTNSIIAVSFSFLLIFINAIVINYLFNKNEFYDRNMYAPSLLYVVLMSYYHAFYTMDGLLIAHTFLILCIYQLFLLKQNEDGRKIVFNAAFFAGIAAVLHPPIILILPLLFVMVWNIRPFVFRESLLLLTGFGIPLIYIGFYLKWLNTSIDIELLKNVGFYSGNPVDFYITFAVIVLFFLYGIIGIQQKLQKSAIRFKKSVRILWLFILLGVILGTIDYLFMGQLERFSILIIPICFFLPYAFISKTWSSIGSILFYITLVYSFLKFFI